jgi:hypothetical protein
VEAAQFARRYDEQARQWFDRKTAKSNKIIASKALASKLAKCAYYIMKNQEAFNPDKIFKNACPELDDKIISSKP